MAQAALKVVHSPENSDRKHEDSGVQPINWIDANEAVGEIAFQPVRTSDVLFVSEQNDKAG